MLLDDLLEARVVQLGELGQIVHVGDDVAQVLLEQLEVFLGRRLLARRKSIAVDFAHDIGDLLLGRSDPADDLLGLDFLEGVDLVQLSLELLDEALLRLVVPGARCAQRRLQSLIVDVVEDPIAVQRLLELLAESARERQPSYIIRARTCMNGCAPHAGCSGSCVPGRLRSD